MPVYSGATKGLLNFAAKYEKMQLKERVALFSGLGEIFRNYLVETDPLCMMLREAAVRAEAENPWFTQDHISSAIRALGESLTREKIERWVQPYAERLQHPGAARKVGLVMAGNIPLVGFHDLLCVLMAGHRAIIRQSTSDRQLLPVIAGIMENLGGGMADDIEFNTGILTGFDAVIATGSNNTSRYFYDYFGKYPHVIRKNRNSIAILKGQETPEELRGLASDIMLYFGMGCRNVSKIFLPDGYDLSLLQPAIRDYEHYEHVNKYRNNYDYYKSIYLINGVEFADFGNLIMTRDELMSSPISVVYYEHYSDIRDVERKIGKEQDQIQCVVVSGGGSGWTCPGMAQKPELWDYADGVDTMEFLINTFC
jgi:hypothetical protein